MINVPYPIIAAFGKPKGDNGKDEAIFYCPECVNRSRKRTPDTKGKLYVNVKTFKYHCFRCNFAGKINPNGSYDERKVYEEEKDVEVSSLIEELSLDTDEFDLVIPIDKVFSNKNAYDYLIKRGFTDDQMEYYDMRVGNLNQEFGRIVIPNQVKRLVYTDFYSARTYIDQKPKYNNPVKKKSNIVFNLHRIKDGTPIILVEGALTAVAAGKHAVASLGKNLSRMQASMIAMKHPSVVYVNYDYGAEEYSVQACSLLKSLMPGTPIYLVKMKDDRDAADLTREEYLSCLEEAEEYVPLYNKIYSIICDNIYPNND